MNAIFERIVGDKNAFFKHQQQDEPELSNDEKTAILKKLFDEKLSIFLSRYQNYLQAGDCEIFGGNDDVLVQTIIQQIQGRKSLSKKQKRNNRFNAMQKLLQDGVYFSDEKMREREPYLFDAMIGKFLSTEQLRPTVSRDPAECTWSTLLDRLEDSAEVAERRNLQEREWAGPRGDDGGRDHISRFMEHVASHDFVPEVEEDDENSAESKEKEQKEEEDGIEKLRKEMEKLARAEAEQYDELGDDDTPQVLRHEFEAFMQQKFLAGSDSEFYDYSQCDDVTSSDPIRERDDEERWFDED